MARAAVLTSIQQQCDLFLNGLYVVFGPMRWPVVLSFCTFFAAAVPAHAEEKWRPVAQHGPAQVTIDRRPAGRRLITLPGIEFTLRIQPDCAPGLILDSLSISIADTRRTFHGTDFTAQSFIETTLHIPRRQVGPLAIDEFCTNDTSADDSRLTAHVADAYTASVSMRCASDTSQSVVYDTLPLDITLQCATANADAANDGSESDARAGDKTCENQDASPLTTRF